VPAKLLKKKKKYCLDLLHGGGLEADPGEEGRLPTLGEDLLLLTTAAALVKRAQLIEQLSLRDPPVLHPEQRHRYRTAHGNIVFKKKRETRSLEGKIYNTGISEARLRICID
jgi:hypothetical protein